MGSGRRRQRWGTMAEVEGIQKAEEGKGRGACAQGADKNIVGIYYCTNVILTVSLNVIAVQNNIGLMSTTTQK